MNSEIFSWVNMIEVPIFAALFRMIIKGKKDVDDSSTIIKDGLAEFKVHVASNYVSSNYLKDVENRLTSHLLRIEKKLEEARRNRNE